MAFVYNDSTQIAEWRINLLNDYDNIDFNKETLHYRSFDEAATIHRFSSVPRAVNVSSFLEPSVAICRTKSLLVK